VSGRPLTTAALTGRRAALLLAALAVVPFARVVFAGHVLYQRDIQLERWGQAEGFARCLAAGAFPLWNAFAGFGRPLLADPGAQALYPWTWLGLLLQPHDWYDVYVLAHVALGGLGVFALARRLGSSVAGSFLSGALFMLAGPFLSVTSLWQHLAGAALLPWVLLAGETAFAAPGLFHTLAWGAIVALQVFAGSLDFVVLGALAQAALATRHALGGSPRDAARRAACVLGAAAFAVALSAVQWLPAVELLRTTVRAQLGESGRVLWSARPVLLLQALVPLFPDDLPLGPAARSLLFDGREPLLLSLYLGAAALPLVVVALLSRPRRLAIVLAMLGLGAVLLALGRHGVAFFWAADALPGLGILRYPVKTMVLAALAWSLLAGRGVDAWPRVPRSVLLAGAVTTSFLAAVLFALWSQAPAIASRWLGSDPGGRSVESLVAATLAPVLAAALAAALAAVVTLVSALRPRTRSTLAVVMLATAVVDLALVHLRLVPSAPREWFTSVPGVVALAKQDRAERLYVVDYLHRGAGRTGPSWKPEETKEVLARPVWERTGLVNQDYPSDGARWALPGAYDVHVAELDSPARRSLGLLARFHQEDGPVLARLLRIGGVTHLAARHTAGLEAFEPVASVRTPHVGEVFLMRVPRPLPRVYVVEGARTASGRALYDALLDPAFDPEREVVLATGEATAARDGFAAAARLVSWRPGSLTLEAVLNRPGYLVVLEGYDGGWRARVDGQPIEPGIANGVFLGVRLPAGRHRVELSYRPRGLVAGAALSGLALAGGGLLLGLLTWEKAPAARRAPRGEWGRSTPGPGPRSSRPPRRAG
jgi:hypothetical protein